MGLLLLIFYILTVRIEATDWSSYCVTFDSTTAINGDQHVIRCIDTRNGVFRDPVLIEIDVPPDISVFRADWYHEAKNMPQIPYSRGGNEELYFLFPFIDKKTDIRTQDVLYMAKLVFDKAFNPDTSELVVQFEGLYKTKEPEDKDIGGIAYTFEDGGFHWEKIEGPAIEEYLTKLLDAHGAGLKISNDLKWKLRLRDRFYLKTYKESLDKLLIAQDTKKLIPWDTKVKDIEYWYHPLYARGIIRWRLSRIGITKAVHIDSFPPKYQEKMKIVDPLTYTFINPDDGKEYTLKIELAEDRIDLVVLSKMETVDKLHIYWQGQFGSSCTRHTVNNLLSRTQFADCKSFMEELAKLKVTDSFKLKFGELGLKLKQHSPTLKTYAHGWQWIAELLHEHFTLLVIENAKKWIKDMLQAQEIGKEHKSYKQYKTKTETEIKKWFKILMNEDLVHGIIQLSGHDHVWYVRKLRGSTTKKLLQNYWLNVNSASAVGPQYVDIEEIDPLDAKTTLYIVLKKGAKVEAIEVGDRKGVPGEYWEDMRKTPTYGELPSKKAYIELNDEYQYDDDDDEYDDEEDYDFMDENEYEEYQQDEEMNFNQENYGMMGLNMIYYVDILLMSVLICICCCITMCGMAVLIKTLSSKMQKKSEYKQVVQTDIV